MVLGVKLAYMAKGRKNNLKFLYSLKRMYYFCIDIGGK